MENPGYVFKDVEGKKGFYSISHNMQGTWWVDWYSYFDGSTGNIKCASQEEAQKYINFLEVKL